jgi:multicomponent K+:H+ antiporter subunit D
MFMIMTKVGAYALLRVGTLVFGGEAGALANLAQPWLLPAALLTIAAGAVGALAGGTLASLVCFSTVWSMGSLLVALGLFDSQGLATAVYYALHSTVAGAALFLLIDLVRERRGAWLDWLKASPAFLGQGWLAALFFIAAIAVAGLPPLSGFIGKLLILDATRASPWVGWIWTVLLVSSLVVIVALARAGSVLFWKSGGPEGERIAPIHAGGSAVRFASVSALLAVTVLLAVFAGPLMNHATAVAGDLLQPSRYVDAVLGPPASRTARLAP